MKLSVFWWSLTALFYSCLLWMLQYFIAVDESFPVFSHTMLVVIFTSTPVFLIMVLVFPFVRHNDRNWFDKVLIILVTIAILTFLYAMIFSQLIAAEIHCFNMNNPAAFTDFFFVGLLFFIGAFTGIFILLKPIVEYFENEKSVYSTTALIFQFFNHSFKNKYHMDQYEHEQVSSKNSNKILIKGLITGGLILLMLIPTVFIFNLINERATRQADVVKEVSSKWGNAQTVSGPFLLVHYTSGRISDDGKTIIEKKPLMLLPAHLEVKGDVLPESRLRSIYKVLLYKTDLNLKGAFKPDWPANIDMANVDFTNAQLCLGISDFKGIEEELSGNLNQHQFLFHPGLPANDIASEGLSVPVNISLNELAAGIPFDMQLRLKGSEQLHFLPMSTNSHFFLKSAWPNPSFDGNTLPITRDVTEKGFQAHWNFNQANLPFSNVVQAGTLNKASLPFGVSMVQPADQYNKTTRSVKYAILIIGLTFGLFFIIELMQKNPMHPVQYVLIGLALVIFYTLLLSISEFLLFNGAYLIAAVATISLVSFYTKSHFGKWSTAAILGAALTALYGFIFVLIQLEDTALLIGSIGLFIVLAIVMFISRKINWYGGHHPLEVVPV